MVDFSARDRLKLLGGGAASLILAGCGGGSPLPVPPPIGTVPPPPPVTPPAPPTSSSPLAEGFLRDHFRNNFEMGAAINSNQIRENNPSIPIAQAQFNSITPEYELKLDNLSPTGGPLNFSEADRVVDWAIENNMSVRGHALVWHESTPEYFLEGPPAQIRRRLESYITEVMTHFSDRIKIWDVVNEALSEDIFNGDQSVGPDRRSNWYEAVGNADYIDWAFQAARAADPTAQLFLSDYETENPLKRGYLVEVLQRLQARNIPIDGVGHQFHLRLDTPPAEVLAALDAVDNQFMGLVNHVTEMDVNCYIDRGVCWQTGLGCEPDLGTAAPAAILADQATLLRAVFDGFVQRSNLESVTFWGVRDGDSWLNFTPAVRSNYPLLFDRDGDPKPCLNAITDPAYQI